jgi:hypothetical protein
MSPADSASRAGATPEASGDSSSGTFENEMNRWFLRLLAVLSLIVLGWSALSTPIVKFSPIDLMRSRVAEAEAISKFRPAQELLLQKGISTAAEIYQSERDAYGKMLRISHWGLFILAGILLVSSFLPFTRTKK